MTVIFDLYVLPFGSVAITFVIPALEPLTVMLVLVELIVVTTKALLKLHVHLLAPLIRITSELPRFIVLVSGDIETLSDTV